MISSSGIVPYRLSRRCSGAIFPVRFWNRHGGSARTVRKRSVPSARRSSAADRAWECAALALIFDIDALRDSKHQHRAPATAATFETRQQFTHVRCRRAGRPAPAERRENILQRVAPRDDDADVQSPQLEQQAEVVQIPVKERIFVVPLDLES